MRSGLKRTLQNTTALIGVAALSLYVHAPVAKAAPVISTSTGQVVLGNGDDVTVTGTGTVAGGATPGITAVSVNIVGLTNAGTILGNDGVSIQGGTTISGAITNSGLINGTNRGVLLGFPVLAGAISNSGTIIGTSRAFSISSTIQGGINNQAGGTFSATDSNGVTVALGGVAVLNGGFTNAGLITSGGNGVSIVDGGKITGGFTNSGIITATNFAVRSKGSAAGYSTISALINQSGGTITATGASGVALALTQERTSNGITNAGLIGGGATGVLVKTLSTLGGGLTNSGVITGGSIGINAIGTSTTSPSIAGLVNLSTGIITATGGSLIGLFFSNAKISSGITNEGRIAATNRGMYLGLGSTLTGTFSNSGTITANRGLDISTGGYISGGIVNSGTILESVNVGRGIFIFGGTIAGGINNSGTIALSNILSTAVFLQGTLSGGLTNSGVMSAAEKVIRIKGQPLSGGLTNSGRISGATGLYMESNGVLSGGLTNSGTITGSVYGIQLLGTSATLSPTMSALINQASGTIQGSNATSGAGLLLDGPSLISSGVTNAGTFIGGAYGVNLNGAATLAGGLTNSGMITGAINGIRIQGTATTSATLSGGLLNQSGGIITATGASGVGVTVSRALISNGFTNAGTIKGNNGQALSFKAATLSGDMLNTGIITVTGGNFSAVFIETPSFLNTFTNSGTIGSLNNRGVNLYNSVIGGGVTNSGLISGRTALLVQQGSSIPGALHNSGTITGIDFGINAPNNGNNRINSLNNISTGVVTATAATGIAIALSAGTISTGITNAGRIAGGATGIRQGNNFAALGGLTNSGTIIGAGATAAGVKLLGTTTLYPTISALINQAGGTIIASGLSSAGLSVVHGRITNGVTNAGIISGVRTGFFLNDFASIGGGITNSGTIVGGNNGIFAVSGGNSVSGGFTNSGLVSGVNTSGIYLQASSLIQDGFTNTGTITSNNNAIAFVSGGRILGGLTNSGTITGGARAINFSPNGANVIDTLINQSGGTLSGTAVGGIAINMTRGTITSGLTNAGLITGGATAISLKTYATVAGGLTNSGIISSSTAAGAGIKLIGTTTLYPTMSALINQSGGTITASGTSGVAVSLSRGVISSGLTNAGRIGGGLTGILVKTLSTLAGGLTNSGVITGATYGVLLSGSAGTLSPTVSALINEAGGTISAAHGIYTTRGSITSGITNAGTIVGTSRGMFINRSSIAGFTNSGTLSSSAWAAAVSSFSTVAGFVNTGKILSAGTVGIFVIDNSKVTGGFTNSGTITGAYPLIIQSAGSISGGLTNSGTLSGGNNAIGFNYGANRIDSLINTSTGILTATGGSGIAINLVTGAITAGLTNAGRIGSAGSAILMKSRGTITGGLTNSGTIIGAGTSMSGLKMIGTSSLIPTLSALINESGGSITASGGGGVALALTTGLISGGVTNAGIIKSNATAILMKTRGTIASGLTNSGTISGTTYGIRTTASGTINPTIGSLVNSSGGTITGVSSGWGISLTRGVITSGLTNAGLINGGGTGILLKTYGTISGGLTNSGTISGVAAGMKLTGTGTLYPTLSGLVNQSGGTITGTGTAGYGIQITRGRISNGITNAGLINPTFRGIALNASTVAGGLTNSGTISASSGRAIEIVVSSTLSGLTNSGTVNGSEYGLFLWANGTIAGGVTNSGLITSANIPIMLQSPGSITGGLTNSGTITGVNNAIRLVNGNNIIDTINNLSAGVMTATGASGIAIALTNGRISTGLTNAGKIMGGATGLLLKTYGTIAGGLTNSGTISGTTAGIQATGVGANFATISGLTNSAGGTITATSTTAGQALRLTQARISSGLTNAGVIIAYDRGLSIYSSTLEGGVTNSGAITATRGNFGRAFETSNATISGFINSGTINSGNYGLFLYNYTRLNSGLTNSGTIAATNGQAIRFQLNTSLSGGLTNSGLLTGTTSGIGISNGANVLDTLNNLSTGMITATGASGSAITITSGHISNGLTNQGRIAGVLTGILLKTNGTLSGGLTNSGTISGTASSIKLTGTTVAAPTMSAFINQSGGTIIATGTSAAGIALTRGIIVNGLTNAGLISSALTGILAKTNGTIAGGLTNSGTIAGTVSAIKLMGTGTLYPTISALINQAGGTINGTGTLANTGIAISLASGKILSGLNNAGVLTGRTGIRARTNSTIAGGLTNSGTINASNVGASINSLITGGLTNSGLMSGVRGLHVFSGSISDGMINTVSGTISGTDLGMYLSGGIINQGLTNSGVITGTNTGLTLQWGGNIKNGLTNTGSISGGVGIGLDVGNGAYIATDIKNSGTISGSTYGVRIGTANSSIEGASNLLTGTITASDLSGVAVAAINGKFVNGLTNAGFIGAAAAGFLLRSSASLTGGLTNSGTILGSGGHGIDIANGGTLTGGITNSGTIAGTTASARLQTGANYLDTLLNNAGGIMTATGATAAAILLTEGVINNGITNSGSILASAATAINIKANGTIAGGVTNNGLISGGVIGIINAGSMTGITALRNTSNGIINGGITNTGTINGSNKALVNAGSIAGGVLNTGTILGGVSNSGTINGAIGLAVASTAVLAGGLTNSGTITGIAVGVAIDDPSTLTGGLTNTGTISGNTGLLVDETSTISGGITNSGTITGIIGVTVRDNSTIAGGLTNSVTIEGTGGTAISLDATSSADIILNGGRVIGDVIDTDATDGLTTVTIADDFTTGGNFAVSSLTVNGSQNLTIIANDIFTADSGATINGNITFDVETLSDFGKIIITNGTADLTNASFAINLDSNIALTNGAEILVLDAATALIGGPGGTPLTLTDNISYWNFRLVDGTAAIAGTGASDLYIQVIRLNPIVISTATTDTLDLINDDAVIVTNTGSIVQAAGSGIVVDNVMADSVVNNGTITGSVAGILITNTGTILSGVTNTGTINGNIGISVTNGSTLAGSLTNSGTIHGNNHSLNLNNSVLGGGIHNTGLMQGATAALSLSAATLSGGISNGGTIRGSTIALMIGNSTITGGIRNSGYITANTHVIQISSDQISGGFTNTGTIAGGTTGILANNVNLTNGFTNSATINGSAHALNLDTTTIAGGLTNSGTLSSNSIAVLSDDSTIAGGFNNSGYITGPNVGYFLNNDSTLSGGLTNSGTINGGSLGILNGDSTILGGLTNSGILSGASIALAVQADATLAGGITNSGTITANTVGMNIRTAGTIDGGLTNSGTINGTSRGINLEANSLLDRIVNNVIGLISSGNGAADNAIRINNATLSAGLTNAGTIDGGLAGLQLANNATLNGTLTNSGTITASTGIAILSNSVVNSGVINTGMIAGDDVGLFLSGSTIAGGVTNNGLLNGTTGLLLMGGARIGGDITNVGTITGTTGTGIVLDTNAIIAGTMTNNGTITGDDYGIYIGQTSSQIQGGLINSGIIIGNVGIETHNSGGVTGGITNSGTIEGINGTAIRLRGQITSYHTDLVLSGGRIIGDVVDMNPQNGLSHVIVSDDFSTEGNFDVSDLTVNASQTLTISQGDTFTADSAVIINGTLNFGVNTISDFGKLVVNNGAVDLTNAILTITLDNNAVLTPGDELLLIDADSALIGGPGGTPLTIVDNSPFWNLRLIDGTGAIANTDSSDLFLQVIQVNPYIVATATTATLDLMDDNVLLVTNTGSIITSAGNATEADGIEADSITNDGTISGDENGIALINGGALSGNIINNGLLAGLTAALMVGANGTIAGGLTNTGTVNGGGSGISINSGATLAGGITNNGTINGNDYGIYIDNAGAAITGGINNTGLIYGNTALYTGNTSSISGGITNSGTIEGTGGTAIRLDDLLSALPITLDGGRIIGDVEDSHSDRGYSTVTVADDFTTEGNFNISSLSVDAGKILTLSADNIITSHNNVIVNGILNFDIASTSSYGALVVSNGAVDLTNATITISAANATLAANDQIRIIDGSASLIGGPGNAPLAVTDNSFLWDFRIFDGTGAQIPTDNTDLFVQAIAISTVNDAATTPNNEAAAAALDSVENTADPVLQQIIANMNNAPTQQAVNDILESVQSPMDTGVLETVALVADQSIDLTHDRLSDLRNNKKSGVSTGMLAQGLSFWGQIFGHRATQDIRDNIAGYTARTYGIAGGVDTSSLFDKTVMGVNASYGTSHIKVDNVNRTDTDINSYQIGLYGDHDFTDTVFANFFVSYGYNDISATRHNVGGITGLNATGDYTASQYKAHAALGKDYLVEAWGRPILTPQIFTTYTNYAPDSYTEKGAGGANLHVEPQSMNALEFGLGVETQWEFTTTDGTKLSPSIHAGYRYDVIGDRLQSTSSFTGGGASFETQGANPARGTLNTGIGIHYQMPSNWSVSAGYDFEVKQDYSAHAAMLRFNYKF